MKYTESNNTNIEIVVKLLKENQIRYIIISPGGTNIAFIKMVQDDPFFKCYSVVDERSAMYFAIGLYLRTGEIIATSCTSAQATRNYIPGLTEAYYKRVPILAITMEKHPRFIYQEYMQAPNQTSLPEDCVKKSFELPFISDENDLLQSIRLTNEAILELTHNGFGPVQLCIPWLDFPLDKNTSKIKRIKRYYESSVWNDFNLENKKVFIIIGEHRPFSDYQIHCLELFSEAWDAVIYANHLSNYNGKYVIKANLALLTIQFDEFVSRMVPDILITIGGQTGDYPLYKILSKGYLRDLEHWRVSEDGHIIDTYDKLTKVFQCSEEIFFKRMTIKNLKEEHRYFKIWEELLSSKTLEIDFPFSNVYVAKKIHNLIPQKSIIQFAILNSLRVWSLFQLHPSINCFSNVGAFGIDGGMSTLIGQSMETEQLCFMITGDLAFYYDMNALAIRYIKHNVRILLINNNGGVEFKLNINDASGNKSNNRYIAASDHFGNADGWAKSCGFKYISAKNKSEFVNIINLFLGKSDKPILFELFINDTDEAIAYQKILDVNSQLCIKKVVKRKVKATIKKLIN